jgi:hypothetical protein
MQVVTFPSVSLVGVTHILTTYTVEVSAELISGPCQDGPLRDAHIATGFRQIFPGSRGQAFAGGTDCELERKVRRQVLEIDF